MEGQSKQIKLDKSSLQNQIVSWAINEINYEDIQEFIIILHKKMMERDYNILKNLYEQLLPLQNGLRIDLHKKDYYYDPILVLSMRINKKYFIRLQVVIS